MSKFKIGDKVVLAPGTSCATAFYDLQGDRDYYTVTDVASEGAFWLQLDFKTRNRVDPYPWHWSYFNMYQEPEDELPPVPRSVSYLKENGRRKLVAGINGDLVNVLISLSYCGKPEVLGYSMEPDAALQLAHDLNRMANEIKRKQKSKP